MDFKARVLSGLKWAAATRLAAQVITWASTILVMRLLGPADYGLLAMASVFMNLLLYLGEGGVGLAVVQAAKIGDHELRQAFGLVMIINTVLFAVMFATAPLVAVYFGEPRLTLLVQVLGTQFLMSIFAAIPEALLARRLDFRRRSQWDLVGGIIGAAATVALALAGREVWALILGSLAGTLVRTIGVNVSAPFLRLPSFDLTGTRRMLAFGGHAVGAKLLSFAYMQGDSVIGGKILGKELLGVYAVALQFASLPVQKVAGMLNPIAMAAFSRVQSELDRFASYLLRSTRALMLFSLPVCWGMSSIAEELIPVLLGAKWGDATVPFKLLALVMPLRLLGTFINSANFGMGRADIVTRCVLITGAVMVPAYFVGAQWGVLGLSAAWAFGFPVAFALTAWIALPSTGVRAGQLVRGSVPVVVSGLGMDAAVSAARPALAATLAPPMLMGALIGIGGVVFCGLTFLINRGGVAEARALLRN